MSKPRSVAPGVLNLGGQDIECHVLDDQRRVLGTTQVQYILGASKNRHLERSIDRISAKDNDIQARPSLEPIEFVRPDGRSIVFGYDATAVLDLCLAYQRAFVAGTLHAKQTQMAIRACEIVGACAKVGIVALVDEATCYQQIRQSRELQNLFQLALLDEHAAWERMFTAELDEAMCRLYGKPFRRNPRWMAGVNARIYDLALGKETAAELRKRNPDPRHGFNHHQLLVEAARRGFRRALDEILLLARTSGHRQQFWDRMAAHFRGEPLQLDMSLSTPVTH